MLPERVFAPARMRVPVLVLARLPVPLTTPATVKVLPGVTSIEPLRLATTMGRSLVPVAPLLSGKVPSA